MSRVRRRTQAGELRLLLLSLFGAFITALAALSLLRAGAGYGRLLLGLGLVVVAWRYGRSGARTVLRLREARNLKAAMQDTGRVLERLKGYELLRRLVGTPGKQEHVVVGPNGIFVITTRRGRVRSKRAAPSKFTGHRESTNPRPDPVEEARIEAACVAERLFCRLGFRPRVRPVLCFPQALVAVGEKRRGVLIVTAPNVSRAIRAQPAEHLLSARQIETIVQALVEPLPLALPASPAFLRLMPRPGPQH